MGNRAQQKRQMGPRATVAAREGQSVFLVKRDHSYLLPMVENFQKEICDDNKLQKSMDAIIGHGSYNGAIVRKT